MPRQLVRREDILCTALRMTRRDGFESVNARSLARETGCSVQPIYSCFENMDSLRAALYGEAMKFYGGFIRSRTDGNAQMLEMALANVDFAKEETNLFRYLFLSKLEGYNSFSDIFEQMGDRDAANRLAGELDVRPERAKEFYIMLIVFTHGIATLIGTGSAEIQSEEIARMLSKASEAFADYQKKID